MKVKYFNKYFLVSIIIILLLYFFMYSALDQGILEHNPYDSYTLQALSWWRGKAALDKDYSWLELAYYNGGIYVSFPPFPSVPMFLLIPIFGGNTPSNLVTSMYVILSFTILYAMLKRKGLSDPRSLFWAGFTTFAGNLLSISFSGGVWYQAQTLSFMMSVLSLYLITSEKEYQWHLGMMCWAFAVGCRPFQILYFPLYVYILYSHLKSRNRPFYHVFYFLITPIIIGLFYALYNYIRFDNIFEFGHNYLIEFTESEYGQFHWTYIFENLPKIFKLPFFEGSMLSFPKFNGFLFFFANPIYIIYFINFIKSLNKANCSCKIRQENIIILICIITHMVLFLAHKTLGGWQFGIRYFIDMIPFAFYTIFNGDTKVKPYEVILCAFGFILNIYGTLWLLLEWSA